MVDPAFGYCPVLPPSAQGPVHDNLIRDRYRILWDTTIDGRLTAQGHLPSDTRERRRNEFCAAFPMLGTEGESEFNRFFRSSNSTHQQLVRFATQPSPGEETHPTGSCPLCRFPTHLLETRPGPLPSTLVKRIREDFPTWSPEDGLCPQCADLYRSRHISDSAEKLIPHSA